MILNNKAMRVKKKSGQILILVLLVVVVSLAIGLSVASQNLTNLKISTQTEQSQRAYTLAENGVESILGQLGSDATTQSIVNAGSAGSPFTGPADSSGNSSSVNVVAKSAYERYIPLGEVGLIALYWQSGNDTYNISWNRSDNQVSEAASLEVTLVYQDSTNAYKQIRWYLLGPTPHHTGEPASSGVDFANSGTGNNSMVQGSSTCNPVNINLLRNQAINASSGVFPNIVTRKFLRIRPLYTGATVNASGCTAPATNLPTQEYDITSTATIGSGVTRKLLVQKSALPQLPAIFDYALYSETNINK